MMFSKSTAADAAIEAVLQSAQETRELVQALSSRMDRAGIGPAERASIAVPSGAASLTQAAARRPTQRSTAADGVEPVFLGDYVYFRSEESFSRGGFLMGNMARMRAGVQKCDEGKTLRESLTFDDFIFRVCPALAHRQQQDLDETESGRYQSESSTGDRASGRDRI